MRSCRILLLMVGLTLMNLPPSWAQTVTVPDAALRAVLEDSLGLSAGDPIPAASLAKLTVLEATDMGITDLTGLEHATGLTRLDLGPGAMLDPWANTNAVSDLSPLSGLLALTWLNVAGNSVADVTPLAGLTGLKWLNLEVNMILDMTSLSSLTKLKDLYVAYNPIPWMERDDWLPRLRPGSTTYLPLSVSHLYPKMDGRLNGIVYSYKDALRWGRVTDRVVPGGLCTSRLPVSDDWDPSKPDFYAWDPSKPARSIGVRIYPDTEENLDKILRFLKGYCITRVKIYENRRPSPSLVWACVPLPLLVPLSERPYVGGLRRPPTGDFPQTSTEAEGGDSGAGGEGGGCGSDVPATGLERAAWGAIKSRLR